ncbi:MAG: hypothetical protein A2147_00835 [Chloroflexi bacterium RBG_16_57_8]|nr:MAG: hypothetical protein A2147_00835 [Chloroflexi bacterium RBG_16_57_8]
MPNAISRVKKATGLLFGTGGVPLSAKARSTVDGIKRIGELGLDCMELEFVRGVKMGEATARQVAEVASQTGIRLTAHAPYYINFNAREETKRRGSQEMLLQTARVAALCGAESVVFHAAFYMGDPPEDTYLRIKDLVAEVLAQLKREKNRVWIRPEVMGKGSEFGTIDEVIRLSSEVEGIMPAIDVAHWHAREGKFNSYSEFVSVLQQVKDGLGQVALDNLHVHFSGIKYSQKGELAHLNLKESDFQYVELLKAFRAMDAKGTIICESPNLEDDARLLKDTYKSLAG